MILTVFDVIELLGELKSLKSRIAELEEDKRSLRDSNLWLKQNYEDLERDYGVMHEKMCARIDKLKGAIEILEDQQREAKNILIDKRLHIDSLYEEGYKLQKRIAELEGENKKAFDFVKTLRTYCIYAHWDNPDTEGEFNEFDAGICKWLSEFTERER